MNMKNHRNTINAGLAVACLACVTGAPDARADRLTGDVKIDGSSTVAPIMMAAAELFQGQQPRIRVTVGVSGTGGGFKKFLADRENLRTDISNASRPIKDAELRMADEVGVEFIEVPIGIDGIAVMANPKNTFCNELTVEELKRIWEPESTVSTWKDIRPEWPDMPLKLYGPDTDSGTFDYFTHVINGKERACRSDYTASSSDNVLVQGVAGDEGALGYFGFSYYEANKQKLKLLGVADHGHEPVVPDLDIIRGGTYTPLSRPIFIYVNRKSYERPAVKAFMTYLLDNAREIVEHPRVNYVSLDPKLYEIGKQRLDKGVTGSPMHDAGGKGKLLDIFKMP